MTERNRGAATIWGAPWEAIMGMSPALEHLPGQERSTGQEVTGETSIGGRERPQYSVPTDGLQENAQR